MRILHVTALLVIAVAAAAQNPSGNAFQSPPKFEWQSPMPGPNRTFQFQTMPNSGQTRGMEERSKAALAPSLADRFSGNTCYFIRSYIMKREDDTGATHLDHVTTCTPSSRFETRKARVRVVPAIQP